MPPSNTPSHRESSWISPSPVRGPFSVLQPLPLLQPGAGPSVVWGGGVHPASREGKGQGKDASPTQAPGDLQLKGPKLLVLGPQSQSRDQGQLEQAAAGPQQGRQQPHPGLSSSGTWPRTGRGATGLSWQPAQEPGELAVNGILWSPAVGLHLAALGGTERTQ